MNPVIHSKSSAKKFGGKWEDYIEIHEWFDETKKVIASPAHRMLRHHSFGIFECMEKFGKVITNSNGVEIPVRLIGEQHVREDCGGKIPSVQDWAQHLNYQRWMNHSYPESDVNDPGHWSFKKEVKNDRPK